MLNALSRIKITFCDTLGVPIVGWRRYLKVSCIWALQNAAICFHSQQTAEKALKALLYSQGRRVVLGHSIQELVRQSEEYETVLANLKDEATLLDQFYIPARYPNGLPSPAIPAESYTESQAKIAQAAAEHVLQMVETFLRQHTEALN